MSLALAILIGWFIGVFFILLFPIAFIVLTLLRVVYYLFIEPKLHRSKPSQDTPQEPEPKNLSP